MGLILQIFLIFVIGVVLLLFFTIKSSNDYVKEMCSKLKIQAYAHKDTLARKRSIYVQTGEYNEVIDIQWRKEVNKFISLVLDGNFHRNAIYNNETYNKLYKIVDDAALSVDINKFGKTPSNIDYMNGIEYEDFCAERLKEFGWEVTKTAATGDQGVDLIATKNRVKVAIQCKRYSGSVGNAAVQEVSAGKDYWHCQHAVVVSNSNYTPSAKNLANKLSVKLIHHNEINDLYKEITSFN